MRRMLRRRDDADDLADPPAQPSRSENLVDSDLRPEAQAAGKAAALSLISYVGRRAVSVFCGREDYDWVHLTPSPVICDLALECLADFVHESGGQIAHAARIGDRDQVLNVMQKSVEVDGRGHRILQEGYLFIDFPKERVVISAGENYSPGPPQMVIGVRWNRDAANFWDRWTAYAREHGYLIGRAFFADGEIIRHDRRYTWDDILLPDEALGTIRTHVEGFLRHRLRLRGLGVKARRGLILSGPPGTGKTLLGKVLADTLGASFMWVTPRHIRNAASFAEILEVARFTAPTVVFLEDLDLFAEERDQHAWIGLGELMNQLDGAADNRDIVTIATTNRLDVIEKALRSRPGRFDRVVEFEAMDAGCRRRLLGRLLAQADLADEDLDYLVQATDDYTGAQLEEVANTLYMLALERENDGDGACEAEAAGPTVDRGLVDAALNDAQIERRGRLGFHAA